MIYIGIDPDVHKSGVAFYDSKDKILELSNLTFFQLFDYLNWMKNNNNNKDFKIRLEAGWLNKKSNWHFENNTKGLRVASRIGTKTGANHETAKKIEEMINYLELQYELIKPTKSKIVDQKYFSQLTGIIGRTNQDQRDAAMLVWGL